MKHSFYYLIMLSLSFSSCVREAGVEKGTYMLINNTSKDIEIELYSYGIYRGSNTIDKHGDLIEKFTKASMGKGVTAMSAFDADFIVLTYENEKRQIYTNIVKEKHQNVNPKSRNILEDTSYTIESEDLYRYIFIEEDYENAEEI